MREALEANYGDPYGIVGNVLLMWSSPTTMLRGHLLSDIWPYLGM